MQLGLLYEELSLKGSGKHAGFTPEGKLWALNEGGAPFQFALDEACGMGFSQKYQLGIGFLQKADWVIAPHVSSDYMSYSLNSLKGGAI